MFTVTRFVNTSQLKRSLFQDSRKHSVNIALSRILFLTGCAYKNLRFASTRGKKMKTMRQLETDKLPTKLPLVYTKTKKRYELLGTLRRAKRAPQTSIFQRRGERLFDPRARTQTKIRMHMRAHTQMYSHTCAQVLIQNMHTQTYTHALIQRRACMHIHAQTCIHA